jgi:hypothetical protein
MLWRRKGEFHDLEQRLRSRGPEPSERLMRSVSDGVKPSPRRAFTSGRLSLAAALTLSLVIGLALLGGFSHSASAARDVANFFQTGSFSKPPAQSKAAVPVSTSLKSSATDQYEEKVTICHRTHPTDLGNTLQLPPSGAANHLKNHQYDYAGPCHS